MPKRNVWPPEPVPEVKPSVPLSEPANTSTPEPEPTVTGDFIPGDKEAPHSTKRGRPRGSRNSPKGEPKFSVESLRAFHELLALLPHMQCMVLSEAEARALLAAWADFTKLYPDLAMPKWLAAWMGLVSACAIVYTPRAFIIWSELKMASEKARRKTANEKVAPSSSPAPHDAGTEPAHALAG